MADRGLRQRRRAAGDVVHGPKYFDWLVLLKFCTAFEPYTKRYTASIRPQKIAEFLLFDPEFPHSICFSVDRMTEALARVAPGAPPAPGARRASYVTTLEVMAP